MILLDTHVWIWWVHGDSHLPTVQRELLDSKSNEGLGVSVISCWEVCKLVEYGRMRLSWDVSEWLAAALGYPGVRLLPLTPQIAVESTRLSPTFHKDPADQMIVATARVHGCSLATADDRIIASSLVPTIDVRSRERP